MTPGVSSEALPESPVVDSSPIFEIAFGYRPAATLFALNEIGAFTALGARALSATEVASACMTDPRATRILLDAGVAIGLVERDDGRYRNGPLAAAVLVSRGPGFLGDQLKMQADLYQMFSRLPAIARSGQPAERVADRIGGNSQRGMNYFRGMYDAGRTFGVAIPDMVDLTGRRRLLDVGGGPGAYSVLLVERYPSLAATVLDLPPVAELARELLAETGHHDRVAVLAADYLTDDFWNGFDVLLLSNILHNETPETSRRLLEKAYRALDPGGILLINGYVTNPDKTTPKEAVLFSVNMLVQNSGTEAYSKDELRAWLAEAGFRDPDFVRLPPPSPFTLVVSAKQ